jgi:hypothetical protein
MVSDAEISNPCLGCGKATILVNTSGPIDLETTFCSHELFGLNDNWLCPKETDQ